MVSRAYYFTTKKEREHIMNNYEVYLVGKEAYEKSKQKEKDDMEKMKEKYLKIYMQEPIEKSSINVIRNMSYEAETRYFYLDTKFYEEFFIALNDREIKSKFLKELFAARFSDVKPHKLYEDLSTILSSSETFRIASLNYKNGNHKFIQDFILNTLDLMKDKKDSGYKDKRSEPYKNKSYISEAEENWSSDVIYWEAVHEGEIVPEDDNVEIYSDFVEDDFYNAYSYDNDSVIRELADYLELIEDCSIKNINEKKEFMREVKKKGAFEAQIILQRIEILEEIHTKLSILESFAQKYNLHLKLSRNIYHVIDLLKEDGSEYLNIELREKISEKSFYTRNYFTVYIGKKDAVAHDLEVLGELLLIMGYEVDFKDYVELIIKESKMLEMHRTSSIKISENLKMSVSYLKDSWTINIGRTPVY